VARVTSSII